jgi:hypothetical protein
MRTWIIVMSFLAMLAWQPQGLVIAGGAADPEPPKKGAISKECPFLQELPDEAEGKRIAKGVIDGDEKLLEKFKAAGLTYTNYVSRLDPYHNELIEAYLRHLDWIQDMQRWELAFINGQPSDLAALFKQLEPRFRHRDAALARAIMYAHGYGDKRTRDKLIALSPDAQWVKAARGHIAEGMTPREAAESMLHVLKDVIDLKKLHMFLFTAQIKPRNERPDHRSREGRFEEVSNITSPESVYDLHVGPHQWLYSLYFERLGALAAETGDAEFIDEIEAKLVDYVVRTNDDPIYVDAYRISAWFGTRNLTGIEMGKLMSLGVCGMGPLLAAYSAHYCPEFMWNERAAAASTAYIGMPDSTICRRNCLARCLQVEDPMISRLTCRLVIALGDDQLATYNDVGRGLLRFGVEPELAKAYAAALKASGDADLAAVAEAVNAKTPEKLDKAPVKKLELTVEQKAAVLAAFSAGPERETCGGAVGVYWLNRATFMAATRNMVEAQEAYWRAMIAAEPKEASAEMTPPILEYLYFVRRNYSSARAQDILNRASGFATAMAARFVALRKVLTDPATPMERKAAPLAFTAVAKGEAVGDDVLEQLTKHPERWGGTGLAFAAESEFISGRFSSRRALYEKACQMMPLSHLLHLRMGPDGEMLGDLAAANWDVASRHTLALGMIEPYGLDCMGINVALHCRNGDYPGSLAARSAAACTRTSLRVTFNATLTAVMHQGYQRHCVRSQVHRCVLADPDALTPAMLDDYQKVLFEMAFAYRADGIVGATASASGPITGYALVLLDTYTSRFDMQDVNNLLNFSIKSCFFAPERAIDYVTKADELGVSRYGRFVGTQALVAAKAQTGKLADVMERYHDMRAGRTGYPPYIDVYMLGGLTRGSNHAEAAAAIEAIEQYDQSEQSDFFNFLLRRAFMLAGRHAEIAEIKLPGNRPMVLAAAAEYSALFHEARALLDAGDFAGLASRTEPFIEGNAQDLMGVYLDAAILKLIALKLQGKLPKDEKTGRMKLLTTEFVDRFLPSEHMIDWHLFEMLCGRAEFADPPPSTYIRFYHGASYGERPSAHYGCGTITRDEAGARTSFIRGVFAWVRGDNAASRTALEECVTKDQRASHEYHVADWLLANQLKEK